jgi:hypothetical protein
VGKGLDGLGGIGNQRLASGFDHAADGAELNKWDSRDL